MAVLLDEPRAGNAPPTDEPAGEPLRRLAAFPDVSSRPAPSPPRPNVATPAPVVMPNTRVFTVSVIIVVVLVSLAWVDWPSSSDVYDTPVPEEKFRSADDGSSLVPRDESDETVTSRGPAAFESSLGKADVARASRTAGRAIQMSGSGRVLLDYILEPTEGKRDGQSRSGVY